METQNQTESSIKKIKLDFKESKYATGRRKKSIAKVWLKKGSGNIHVNGKKMVDYFHWVLSTHFYRIFSQLVSIRQDNSLFFPTF